MNKRQKKKREKKILLWELKRNEIRIAEKGIDFNGEGYRDSTAAAAIRNVMKDEQSHT